MQFHQSTVRFAAFAALVVAPALSGCASDSSGAHVFARRDNGTNIVSRLVPDGTDVVTAGMISSFAQYYPEGNVRSAAEFTPNIKYTLTSNATERTAVVKPFCNIDGTATNDNSSLVGPVVIPPFVDAKGNGYITDDGTRYKVVGVSDGPASSGFNTNLTAIVAPNTMTTIAARAFIGCTKLTSVSLPAATSIGDYAFRHCISLDSISLPAATSIGSSAFIGCTKLTSISLPAATSIGDYAFSSCNSLTSVSLPAATSIGGYAFGSCNSLTSVDFGATPRSSVPFLGSYAFYGVPTSCKIIVPYTQYDAWTAETLPDESSNPWYKLVSDGYKFLRHSEWEYARKYEVDKKLDKSGGTVTGPVLINSENATAVGPLTLGFNIDPEHVDNALDIIRASNGDIYLRIRDTTLADMVQLKLPRTSGTFALAAEPSYEGNLAALDSHGNPVDSGIAKTSVVTKESLSGKTMPANPSDAELRAAVSNIWEALGGKFQ